MSFLLFSPLSVVFYKTACVSFIFITNYNVKSKIFYRHTKQAKFHSNFTDHKAKGDFAGALF